MAGVSVIESTKIGTAGVAVTPSVTYSVLSWMKASVASLEARVSIRWYTAAGAASATPVSAGTFTALSTSAWTIVNLNAASSPADAAFAAVEIEWRHTVTTVVGQYINVDNIVLSRSSQAAWGPGGTSTNIKFVLERSADGGISWEAVWGQNYDNPLPSRSQSDTRVIVVDRSPQLNKPTNQLYRAYAIGYDTNNLPVYSLATITTHAPAIESETAFLRNPTETFYDGTFQIDSYTRAYNLGGDVFAPQGSDYGVVQYDTSPQVETIDFTVWCIGIVPLSRLVNLLQMKQTLFVQLATNATRYIRPVGDFSIQAVRAAPIEGDVLTGSVRLVNRCNFRAITLQPPQYVNKAVTL